MQFNITFKTIFEYILKKISFVHTNTFCKYRKKYAHRLACILIHYTSEICYMYVNCNITIYYYKTVLFKHVT